MQNERKEATEAARSDRKRVERKHSLNNRNWSANEYTEREAGAVAAAAQEQEQEQQQTHYTHLPSAAPAPPAPEAGGPRYSVAKNSESPKSASFTSPCSVIRIFPALMSL